MKQTNVHFTNASGVRITNGSIYMHNTFGVVRMLDKQACNVEGVVHCHGIMHRIKLNDLNRATKEQYLAYMGK